MVSKKLITKNISKSNYNKYKNKATPSKSNLKKKFNSSPKKFLIKKSDNSTSSIKKDLTATADAKYYDKLFEEKLKSQYTEFRDVKDKGLQMQKFLRMLMIIFIIVLFALLLLTFTR